MNKGEKRKSETHPSAKNKSVDHDTSDDTSDVDDDVPEPPVPVAKRSAKDSSVFHAFQAHTSLKSKYSPPLPGWKPGTSTYEGDEFPQHFDEKKKHELKKKYRALPDIFYTKTGLPVISPSTIRTWLRRWAPVACFTVLLWEMCSGSGRLSYTAW